MDDSYVKCSGCEHVFCSSTIRKTPSWMCPSCEKKQNDLRMENFGRILTDHLKYICKLERKVSDLESSLAHTRRLVEEAIVPRLDKFEEQISRLDLGRSIQHERINLIASDQKKISDFVGDSERNNSTCFENLANRINSIESSLGDFSNRVKERLRRIDDEKIKNLEDEIWNLKREKNRLDQRIDCALNYFDEKIDEPKSDIWIDIDDKLPETQTLVLISFCESVRPAKLVSINTPHQKEYFFCELHETLGWCRCAPQPKYWTPFPEPKEE